VSVNARAGVSLLLLRKQDPKHTHPPYVPLLRHALRAGFAVRFGILPSQSAP